MSLPLAGTIVETATLFTANGYLKRYLSGLGHMQAGDDLPMPYVLLAGAGTGLCVSFVLTPIELVKCRLQVMGQLGPDGVPARTYSGPIDCLMRSTHEEGLRVLYRGHVGTVLREVPGTACWFGAYETFVRAMTPKGLAREQLPSWVIIAAGALGGMAYWSVMYPADTVKSVMQTVVPSDSGNNSSKPTFGGTFMSMYRNVGLRGLYAGIWPTIIRAAPSNAVIFLGYEWAARLLGQVMGIEASPDEAQILAAQHAPAAAVALIEGAESHAHPHHDGSSRHASGHSPHHASHQLQHHQHSPEQLK